MALVSGDQDVNQGTGCPGTVVEECTGPYALFGDGNENVYPTHGFTVTDDLYLDPGTAAPDGALIDDDVEINNSSGAYGIDNVITACPESGAFVINFGHNSPGSCETPASEHTGARNGGRGASAPASGWSTGPHAMATRSPGRAGGSRVASPG
jgi:hypothetical protein